MPSDERARAALEALAQPRDAFRSAVATADEEVRAYRLNREQATDPGTSLARELGPFSEGRIDARRLAGLLSVEQAPDPLTDRLMGVAHEVFREVTGMGAEAFHVEVAGGDDLRDTVRDTLAGLGRAFGVSHAVEKARSHRYDPDKDYALLHPYPFHRWTPAERQLAPPVVVSVKGEDLRAAGLAEYLDGAVKLVLVVEGPVEPAPLARLITSSTFVAQTTDVAAVSALAGHGGSGVVAWVEPKSGAVEFAHDPSGGPAPRERLTLAEGEVLAERLAELESRGRNGGRGVADLRHLTELATPDAQADGGPPEPADGPAAADAADRLAAWLLARTDLEGL